MITGMEIAACQHMAVPAEVMQHVVNVESGYNPFAIGVVGGKLVRQPQNLGEALATVHMLEAKGYNYSLGVAQVNRANLGKYGLTTYQQAFDVCPNLTAGARILSECYASSGNDWGKSFSCYYSGNFVTGYRDGYVQKIYDSIDNGAKVAAADKAAVALPIQLVTGPSPSSLRGALGDISPAITPDSAGYRVAIRSSMLDTAATMATGSLAAALGPTSASADTAPMPSPSGDSANAIAPPSNAPVQPAQTAATADVFEPQVRGLGDPPQTAAAASANQPQVATASTPSAAAVDRTDVRQGNRDDAFVF